MKKEDSSLIKLQDDKRKTIDIFIKDVDELYASSNYSSLRNNALSNQLEKYLLHSIKNYKLNDTINIILHIPANTVNIDTAAIHKAFTYHFSHKVEETELYLKHKFKQWRLNLFIGGVFLCTCFILLELFNSESGVKIVKMFRESLLIVGWVALWEPITFLLFGWHPILKKKLYYRKLEGASISVHRYAYKANSKL
jgi:hypothetical protein